MSIRVQLPEGDDVRIGFACSPALEAILSLSVLIKPKHHPLHHDWARQTRRRLPREMKQGLADFRFRHMDHIPAGLVPPAGSATLDFAADMERIRALPLDEQSCSILRNLTGAPPETWCALDDPSIREQLLERAAEFGTPTVRLVNLGLDRPEVLVDTFLGMVELYWNVVFGEWWDEFGPRLEEARADGARALERGELWALLGSMHPRIAVDASQREFRIRRAHERSITLTPGAEVTFVPSGFLWPHLGLVNDTPEAVAVLYPATFASYEAAPNPSGESLLPLLRALGDRTRLEVLKLVAERPRSTQELATLIGLSDPAVSKHLRVLAASGVVESRRDGYYRLYSLSRERIAPLSAMLLDFVDGVAGDDPPPDL